MTVLDAVSVDVARLERLVLQQDVEQFLYKEARFWTSASWTSG